MSRKIPLNVKDPKSEKVKSGYDEKSPITGKFSVLVETVEFENSAPDAPKSDIYKICIETGYQTYWNAWKQSNSELLDQLESQMPKNIASHKFVDANGHVWYPMMTFSYVAALHPHVDSDNQLKWCVSEVTMVTEDSDMETHEIVKLPVETNKGITMGLFKIANTPKQIWELYQFEDALNFYESVVNEWVEFTKQNSEKENNENAEN